MCHICFTSTQETGEKEAALKAYIYDAIEVEKAGLKVGFKERRKFTLLEEFHEIG